MRHGAASEAALRGRSLTEIQHRLRHTAAASTKRYEKHTRYLAELGRIPASMKAYAAVVEKHLVQILTGSVNIDTYQAFRADLAHARKHNGGAAKLSRKL